MAQGGISPDGKFLAESSKEKQPKELSLIEKVAFGALGIGALALAGYFGYELKKDYYSKSTNNLAPIEKKVYVDKPNHSYHLHR